MRNILSFLVFLAYSVSLCGQETNIYPASIKYYNAECDSALMEQEQVFKHSLVSKEVFEGIEDNRLRYIGGDDSHVRWNDNSLEIVCTDSIVSFEDMPEDEYGYYSTYNYVGQLISGQPYSPFILEVDFTEYNACIIVDNRTGEENQFFMFPIISADGKHLIDFSSEPFSDEESWITIYKMDRESLNPIATLSYNSSLIPSAKYGGASGKWDEDGTLYVPVLDMGVDRWDENGVENITYLKLEIDMGKLK